MPVSRLRLRCIEDGRYMYKIASALDIPAPRLSEYVYGRTSIPPNILMSMCKMWQVGPEDILGWADEDEYAVR